MLLVATGASQAQRGQLEGAVKEEKGPTSRGQATHYPLDKTLCSVNSLLSVFLLPFLFSVLRPFIWSILRLLRAIYEGLDHASQSMLG